MSLTVTQINADWATGARKDREHFAYLCEFSDLLILEEVKNIEVARCLPVGWTALQDRSTTAKAGVAFAYRDSAVQHQNFRLRPGASPFINGRRIQMETRYIETCRFRDKEHGDILYGIGAHLPPKRFKSLQPGMMRKIRRIANTHPRTVLGSDMNQPYRAAGAFLGLTPYGQGIDGLFVGPYIQKVGKVRISNFGKVHGLTDHITVTATFADQGKR